MKTRKYFRLKYMKLGVEYLNLQSPLRQRLIVIETTDFFVQDSLVAVFLLSNSAIIVGLG